MDLNVGVVGTATGLFSRAAAESEAMRSCIQLGGAECKPSHFYENQCAVVAWPSVAATGQVIVQGGPTIELATQLVLPKCAEISGHECKIVYANCTKPVLGY